MNAPKWVLPLSPSPSEFQLTSASLEGSPKSASRSDPGSFWITSSVLGLKVWNFVCALMSQVCFLYFSGSVEFKPCWISKPNISLPGAGFLGWGPQCGSWTPRSLEKTSKIVIFLLFVCHWPRLEGPDCTLNDISSFPIFINVASSLYL